MLAAGMPLLLLAVRCDRCASIAQQPQPPASNPAPDGAPVLKPSQPQETSEPVKSITGKDRRRATKLYLEATKLFEKRQFEQAMRDYEEAAALDPENPNYAAAARWRGATRSRN